MAETVLVIGPSGIGKTYAGRHLSPEETTFIVPEKKALPFKGWKKNYKKEYRSDGSPSAMGNLIYDADINRIREHLINIGTRDQLKHVKTVLIDTLTYALIESVMREQKNESWSKYVTFADEFKALIETAKSLREDLMIIFTAHDETESGDGFESVTKRSFKIPAGRFTKEKIVPEGLFTVVLFADVKRIGEKNVYFFRTQTEGHITAKSPAEMFPQEFIPNDYAFVIKCINAYNNGEDCPKLEGFSLTDPENNSDNF